MNPTVTDTSIDAATTFFTVNTEILALFRSDEFRAVFKARGYTGVKLSYSYEGNDEGEFILEIKKPNGSIVKTIRTGFEDMDTVNREVLAVIMNS
jgi:hypothetical protein